METMNVMEKVWCQHAETTAEDNKENKGTETQENKGIGILTGSLIIVTDRHVESDTRIIVIKRITAIGTRRDARPNQAMPITIRRHPICTMEETNILKTIPKTILAVGTVKRNPPRNMTHPNTPNTPNPTRKATFPHLRSIQRVVLSNFT